MTSGSSILFFDPVCPHPYSTRTRQEAALAGTEATVSRIADALDAFVMQHNRIEAEGRYLPPTAPLPRIEHVVLLRDPRRLKAVHGRFADARFYLWMHDIVQPDSKHGRRLAAHADVIRHLALTIVCVSESQRQGIQAVLRGMTGCGHVQVQTIYNAIDDALAPNGAPFDATKLVFFSSPHKGLAYTLDAFQILRKHLPEMRLVVGNPGYKKARNPEMQGVEWRGPLPHQAILAEVRTALCVFYPNFVVPETFGLVLAEANAIGTPVLTHACGAAQEVIADPRQIVPVMPAQQAYERAARFVPLRLRRMTARWAQELGIFEPYVERIRAWKDGERPRTGPDSRFRLHVVADRWRALFADQLSDA